MLKDRITSGYTVYCFHILYFVKQRNIFCVSTSTISPIVFIFFISGPWSLNIRQPYSFGT